jgi:hypothetical protein
MDQAALSDDLEPGRLKDEIAGNFDPSQETYEDYLRRINLERPFNMAEGGQLVAPSVDGSRPGYSGPEPKHTYVNDPDFLDFQKKNPGDLHDQLRKYERMLSKKNKIIGIRQLYEALGPDTPYTYETLNNVFSRADKKITKNMSNVEKNYIKAGQRIKKIIIDTIGEPTTLGEIQKDYKYIRAGGVSTDKVWDLSKAKINKLNKALLKNYNVTGLRPNTIDNVFELVDDKNFIKSLKAYKGGKIDETSPLFKTLFKEGSGDMPYAYMTLGRALRGEITLEGIKKDRALGNKIIRSLSGDFQGPLGTAATRWAKFQMAKHFDDPKASYDTITQTIKNAFKDVGIKNLDIDEIFPARTGQITIGKGSGAYNQIVQVIDEKINQGAKKAFDGRASKRYRLIIDAYKNKNFNKVKQLVDAHQTDINKFYKRNPEAKGKVKLTKLNYDPVKKRFASPTEIYGKDVFPSKIQKDMDKFYRKTGLSLDVGSTMTLEKAAKDLKKATGDPKQQIKILKQMGYRCAKSVGAGETVECYMDDVKKTRADMKSQDVTVRAKALTKQRKALQVASKLPQIGKIVRQGLQAGAAGLSTAFKWTGLGAPIGYAIEGMVEGGIYDYYRKQGYNHDQAFAETFTPGLIAGRPEDVAWYGGAEKLREKELYGVRKTPTILEDGTIVEGDLIPGKVQPKVKQYTEALKDQQRVYDAFAEKERGIKAGRKDITDPASADIQDLYRSGTISNINRIMNPESMASQAYNTAVERQQALDERRKKDYMDEYYNVKEPSPFMQEQKQKDRYKEMEEMFPPYTPEDIQAMYPKLSKQLDAGQYKDLMEFFSDLDKKSYYADNFRMEKAGGGIAGIRRPNAIPPKSGPNPQGLPSMYNRVKRI